ncbi:nuclear transport factor 2 family protein [Microbacterium capsulatum]|uniref:Nuclear transport factor 2 family protein n=1 Tax=Microbacterium capsulatum TaxID=3041921 RepID=A0ABU0XEY2_9MICO|nr:nuclear transport factor 2 family protein [Microbacterium sp. ASV81]MDQ4213677.1 nuclear transport factor 2 family protein [Microbacterium sp. ASV81]
MSVDDRVEIAMLIARIAQLADDGSVGAYLDCFTTDAEWELADASGIGLEVQTRRGRADLEAGVRERRRQGMQGPGSRTRHDVSTIAIAVDGDRASSRAYYRYYLDTHATPRLATMGVYDDAFTRGPDGWRLARRTITRS